MNGIRNIVLGVKRGVFRQDDPQQEHHDKEFKELRDSIKERDDYTCFYCGFKSMKYQEVHHINDNHQNNKEENLTTVCPLCHSCKHIGLTGLDEKGFLIYYPGITQVEVNILSKVLWIGKNSQDEKVANVCKRVLQSFEELREHAETMLTSDPAVLGTLLLELEPEEYRNRQSKIQDFLLVHDEVAYKKQIRYWEENIFKNIPPHTWTDIAKQYE